MASVDHLSLRAGGSGYTSAPTVTLSGDGSGATATATVLNGAVVDLVLTAGGSGYLTPPAVAFSGGGGSGAQAAARLLAPYATPAQFRAYLPDVTESVATDAQLYDVLDRSTDVCNRSKVGLGFAFAGYVTEARPVYSQWGRLLWLPPHQPGSVTSILAGTTALVVDTDYTVLTDPATGGTYYRHATNWRGATYTVTAAWGFGPPPPAVEEVCLELAVGIWQARKAGRFSPVIGATDGGAVVYEGSLTGIQRSILVGVRQQYLGTVMLV